MCVYLIHIIIHTNPNKPQVKASSNFNNLGLDQGNITQLIEHLNDVCYFVSPFLFNYAEGGEDADYVVEVARS